MSLLKLYIVSERLKFKREIIQRRIIFNKPVYGLSLNSILEKEYIKRKEQHTDTSRRIDELNILEDKQVDMFKKSWYFNLSDIKKDNIYYINKEIDLPWNAIKEIKSISNDEDTISLLPVDNVVEEISVKKAINKLLNSKNWVNLLFIEYSIKNYFFDKLNNIIESSERKSKKHIVDKIYDSKRKAKNNTKLIADIFNLSESYVKDIINNRIKYGLSDSEREEILSRDNYQCQNCCSEKNLEVHHIIPVSDGGDKQDDNLCTLCFNCHFNIAHGRDTSSINYNTKEEFWNLIQN